MFIKLHTSTEGKIKTIIYIRGFDRNFEVELYRDNPVSIAYAEWWAKSQIIETAMVTGVTHFLKVGVLYIANENNKQFKNKKNEIIKQESSKKSKTWEV
jgi:hypothetical protein